jgi:phosphoglycerol transferase MdoB-like AlkP superfamily enzyme
LIIYGKLARYPLRWSEAFFTPDSFVSYLGVNPVLFLYKSLWIKPLNYDIEETKKFYPVIADYYGIEPSQREKLSLLRRCKPIGKIKGSPNLIFILLETFASFKANVVNDGLDSSPNFNRLCKQGLYFPNFFVPTEMTSRSLFAFLFGIPDVSQGRYSSWNPMIVDQYSILNSFSNYEKCYFLGGSANWGNIRGVLSHNIKDLIIYEEGSYRSPVHDVWGISDADLFWEAHNILKNSKDKPFMAFIQTSGNHRPFRIPHNSRGFRRINKPKKLLKKNGFYSVKEYNGFRFLDHCLGYFINLARNEDYFKNTIFIMFGDHGTMGGAIDKRFGDLSFGSFKVPLLIYAPGLIKEPKTITTILSEMDLLPSIASLIGKSYINTSLGRDIFNPYFRSKPFAFTYTVFRAAPRMGLISPEFYLNMEPGGAYNLYRWDSSSKPEDLKQLYPEKALQMAEMTKAIYEYSRYLLYHNKKKNAENHRSSPIPFFQEK